MLTRAFVLGLEPLKWVILATFLGVPGFAQLTGCPTQYTSPIILYGWQKNPLGPTLITYYISPTFNTDQKNQIKAALQNWEERSAYMCTKVDFEETTDREASKLGFFVENGTGTRMQPIDANLVTHILLQADIIIDLSEFSPTQPGYDTVFLKAALHEIGHTMGLDHPTNQTSGRSVMNGRSGINDSNNLTATSVQPCDEQSQRQNPQCPPPSPSPSPTPFIPPWPPEGCLEPIQNFTQGPCPLTFQADSSGYYCCRDPFCAELEQECNQSGGIWKGCTRGCYSPILIDIEGDGFDLTDGPNGVDLDLTGEGPKNRVSWTAPGSDDAWLALDRDGNGTIDNGMELFGNFTPQSPSIPVRDRNGFSALAEYDKPENGGNGDNFMSPLDSIFESLRLWQDADHNGVSEGSELKTLPQLGLHSIDLNYSTARRRDGYGNRFAYRSKVLGQDGAELGRWAWDVFLLSGSSSGGSAGVSLIQPFPSYQPMRPSCGLTRSA